MSDLSDDIKSEIVRIGMTLADRPSAVSACIDLARETWTERAAIREYDGGQKRRHAEHLAIVDTCEILGVRYTVV